MKIDGKIYDILHKKTKINRNLLKNYVYGQSSLSKARAIFLESACNELGINISAEKWMFGSSDFRKKALKNSLLNYTETQYK